MIKFLIAEIIISAIYTLMATDALKEGLEYFLGALAGSMIASLGFGYLVAVCITRKSPRIHKIAFVVFCVFITLAGCQAIHEVQMLKEKTYGATSLLEKDLRDSIIEIDKISSTYDTNTTPEQIEKDMKKVADGIMKAIVQGLLTRLQKTHVPEAMLQNTNFLYSKEKLSVAIRRQDTAIKQYKKEINTVIDDAIQGSTAAALTSCVEAFTQTECEKLKEPFEQGLLETKNKLYASVLVYSDYLEEELNAMRFIYNHYNKFTTSGKFPHFTDTALQNQFISKIQAVDKKARAVAELRNNALKEAHDRVSKI